jgi:hypothetical protein
MSFLHGSKKGTNPYQPPGIYSTVDEARQSAIRLDIIQASYNLSPPRKMNEKHTRAYIARGLPSENTLILNPRTSKEARAALGFFLMRIELDIETNIPALLNENYISKQANHLKFNQDPRFVIRGIEGVELQLTSVLKDSFGQFFPDGLELWCKLVGNDFSFQWKSWCNWCLDEKIQQGGPTVRPSGNDLVEWINQWVTIWGTLLVGSKDHNKDSQKHHVATETWKSLVYSLASHFRYQG